MFFHFKFVFTSVHSRVNVEARLVPLCPSDHDVPKFDNALNLFWLLFQLPDEAKTVTLCITIDIKNYSRATISGYQGYL